MKNLFLLLSAGLIGFSAGAQQSQSVMLTPSKAPRHSMTAQGENIMSTHTPMHAANHALARTTGVHSSWYSYFDELAGPTAALNPWAMYNDSTVTTSAGNFNFIMGLGTSFDPTSTAYTTASQNLDLVEPFVVTPNDAYTVDSLTFQGRYFQLDPTYTDTLFVDMAVVGSTHSGTYNVYDSDVDNNLNIPGQHYNFATANYDTAYNGLASNVATKQTIKIPLNAAVVADTDANGFNDFALKLTPVLNASAGDKIIVDIHFKSMQPHAFGALVTSVNHWFLVAGELNSGSYDFQFENDLSSGLCQQTFERYALSGPYPDGSSGPYYANLGGTPIVNGSYLSFGVGQGFAAPFDPYIQFHLNCNTCYPLGVNTVNNTTKVAAFPNPASSNVNVSFTLASASDVTITLTNEIGQTVTSQNMGTVQSGVATLNTSTLSNGLYFYTVNAGGQRSTGKVVVAH